jgi:hypothetical protein
VNSACNASASGSVSPYAIRPPTRRI